MAIHGSLGPMWQEQRIIDLLSSDPLIWDMGMRLADISVMTITTGPVAGGEIITDGPIPNPTDDFTRMAGFEYVRRGGHITADVDAFTIAKATLAVRCWPMDELLKLKAEMMPATRTPDLAAVPEDIDPSGNGPINEGGDVPLNA